jgi:hypothetical protein
MERRPGVNHRFTRRFERAAAFRARHDFFQASQDQPERRAVRRTCRGAMAAQASGDFLSALPQRFVKSQNHRGATGGEKFYGFGDPLFKENQAPGGRSTASRGIVRRNATAPGALANAAQLQRRSSNLELLEPLPDTSEEVRDIAKILRADPSNDVHLGGRASEQLVKRADLSQYRVVMFATHGLVAGELPELSQPALALSNPNLTNEKDDGLLTLAEILELKLRADWVVLSACNTASADGQASEAVSGLGRAFFFAGAKALLVSHWPVETGEASYYRIVQAPVGGCQTRPRPSAARCVTRRHATIRGQVVQLRPPDVLGAVCRSGRRRLIQRKLFVLHGLIFSPSRAR